MNVEFLLLLLFYPYSFTSGHNPEDRATASCPTWYHMTSDGKCECGEDFRFVLCSTKKRVELMNGFCMGYDNASKVTVLGYCPYSEKNTLFYELPQDVEDLNNFTCSWLNRRGLLCSHCEESLGVAALSYSYECTKCLGTLHACHHILQHSCNSSSHECNAMYHTYHAIRYECQTKFDH